MQSAEHVNYLQKDNDDVQIIERPGVVILPSLEAYKKIKWSQKYFQAKPEKGYFIWIKKTIDIPLQTNIMMCSKFIVQNTLNLVVLEKNVEAKIQSVCAAAGEELKGKHLSNTKIVVKENAKLKMNSFHKWGKEDVVNSIMEFILKKEAEVSFTNKCYKVPMRLKMENQNYLEKESSLNYANTIIAQNGEVEILDNTFLNGKGARGVSRIRMVAKEKSQINARSHIIANKAGEGHLDCMGLLLADESMIIAIPALVNKNKESSLTHEASVGKISAEVLNYLRSRGLTEDEAIDLVVTGFLGEEEDIVIDGNNISPKLYM